MKALTVMVLIMLVANHEQDQEQSVRCGTQITPIGSFMPQKIARIIISVEILIRKQAYGATLPIQILAGNSAIP